LIPDFSAEFQLKLKMSDTLDLPMAHAILYILSEAPESCVSRKLERNGGLVFFQAMPFRHEERSTAPESCVDHVSLQQLSSERCCTDVYSDD
jgi:hypothetical protein